MDVEKENKMNHKGFPNLNSKMNTKIRLRQMSGHV